MKAETAPAQPFDLRLGNCLDVMALMEADSIHAIVTDPPYGLTANKKGGSGAKSVNLDSPAGRSRITTGAGEGGFMGMKWDHGVPGVEHWAAALRVAKPGAFLLAFGGTRTYHRLTCAIEDAGWEIMDCLLWLYGSGFPKSLNVGEGRGTALKPAWEPVIVARKPFPGTVVDNVAKYGTGALNIDACRIPGAVTTNPLVRNAKGFQSHGLVQGQTGQGRHSDGRRPANVIHDGSDEVTEAFPIVESGKPCGTKAGNNNNVFGQFAGGIPVTGYGDAGSAARFFYCAKADRADRNEGLEGMPVQPLNWSSGEQSPGTSATNRQSENFHPTVKPAALMRYLCRLVTPPGGVILDPYMGSGSTGKAALHEGFRFVGIEIDPAYFALAEARIIGKEPLFRSAAG